MKGDLQKFVLPRINYYFKSVSKLGPSTKSISLLSWLVVNFLDFICHFNVTKYLYAVCVNRFV
jgi:hypothetical protein